MHCRNGFSTFQDINHGFLNNDPYIVPEAERLIIFYSKYAVCMADNVKDTNNTRYIDRRVNF